MNDLPPRRPSAPRALLVVVPALLAAACGPTGGMDVERAVERPSDGGGASAPDAARRDDAKGITQVLVPAGTFRMGTTSEQAAALSPPGWAVDELASEQPAHAVRLSHGYWIDAFEVSNAAYQAFVDDGGYTNNAYWSADGLKWLGTVHRDKLPVACVPDAPPDHPRVCVTWFEAEAYARWRGGRLPTEAEWEYAARGLDAHVYPWGDEWSAANANVVGSLGLTAVGAFPAGASWVGAHDMAGNAMEWVADWLDGAYYAQLVEQAAGGEIVDPAGPASGAIKIEKGGWWGSDPFTARAAYRHFEDGRSYQDHHIGFRVVSDEDEG